MLTIEKTREILKKPALKSGLVKYQYLMDRLHRTDVSADAEFQRVYRDFYQMRRFYSDDFARRYFRLMEDLKDSFSMSFPMAMERIKHIQGTYEMSFSSKMAHTIAPQHPIWDSVVAAGHFKMRAPAAGCKDREQKCCLRYQEFTDKFYRYMATEEGKTLLCLFDEAFPNSGISDVKKIDFILWQDKP